MSPIGQRKLGSRSTKIGEIELYRILAAVLVVLFHIRQNMQVKAAFSPAQGLHLGSDYPYQNVRWFEVGMSNVDIVVDFFFATSALLVALPWARAVVDGTGRPSTRSFAVRRLLRAVPLYWVVVLTIWTLRNHGYPGDWRDLVEHLTFTQWLDSKRIFYTDGPAWSLGVEVWLYPLVPLLLIPLGRAAARLRRRALRFALAVGPLLLVAAGSVFWKYYVDDIRHEPGDHWAWRFGLLSKVDTFAFGVIAALVVAWAGERRMSARSGVLVRLLALGGLGWFLSHRLADVGYWQTFAHTAGGLASAVLLTAVMLSRPGRLAPLVNRPIFAELGALTFGVYITHETLLDPLHSLGLFGAAPSSLFRNWAIGLPLALALGFLAHHLVEEPMNRLNFLWDRRGRWRRESYEGLTSDWSEPMPLPVSVPAPRRPASVAPQPA